MEKQKYEEHKDGVVTTDPKILEDEVRAREFCKDGTVVAVQYEHRDRKTEGKKRRDVQLMKKEEAIAQFIDKCGCCDCGLECAQNYENSG